MIDKQRVICILKQGHGKLWLGQGFFHGGETFFKA